MGVRMRKYAHLFMRAEEKVQVRACIFIRNNKKESKKKSAFR